MMHRPQKIRILLMAEAVSLAHVGRLAALARSLDSRHYEVCFACDPRYNALLGDLPARLQPLGTISGRQFTRALSRGLPIYSTRDIVRYVHEDLALMRAFRPHAVVGDFRLSLAISARLADTPYLTVTNAYWSPHAVLDYPVPELPIARVLGPRLGQRVFDLARPLAFALHARPVNQARKWFGLAPLDGDVRTIYTDADYTLFADVPELVPTAGLPSTHRFVGPLPWSPSVQRPAWWDEMPEDRPIVYVTLGSSGESALLGCVLEGLRDLPVFVVAATAGRGRPGTIPPNARVSDFVPGAEAAARARLVICNGGSPTSYQALAAGVPVIGLPGNLDQYLNITLLETAGAGRMLRAGKVQANSLRSAVRDMLADPQPAARARALQAVLARLAPGEAVKGVLREALGARPADRHRRMMPHRAQPAAAPGRGVRLWGPPPHSGTSG
ncbi:MAG: glycosyltransferase [Betaproteobacteria bacterium]|nr:glycosyltransferase [Betaproteobacteria bacterium]